jgi:anti-anti-sigma factor
MRIEHARRGDVTVVEFEGDFDFHDVTSAAETIGAFIDGGALRLVFDLKRLGFISSGGIGYFLQTAKRLRAKRGELVLAEPPESFGWVATTLGIDRVIRVLPTADEALRYFAARPDREPPGPAQAAL